MLKKRHLNLFNQLQKKLKAEEPAAEEVKAEEPAAEEVKAEEPAAEEEAEEPAADETEYQFSPDFSILTNTESNA